MTNFSNREFARILFGEDGEVAGEIEIRRLIAASTNPADKYRVVLEHRGLSALEIAEWKIFFYKKIIAKHPEKFKTKRPSGPAKSRVRLIPVKEVLNIIPTDEQNIQINSMSSRKRERINFILSIIKKAQNEGILDATPSNKELVKLLRIENQKTDSEISPRRFQEIVLKIRKFGLQKFIDDWSKSGKGREGKTIISEIDMAIYVAHYARDNYIASNQAYIIVKGHAINQGRLISYNDKDFPHERTFYKQAQKMKLDEVMKYIRKGEDYWKRNDAPYITRDISNLRPMQVLVGDCMTCDTWVRIPNCKVQQINKNNGKEKFQPDWIAVRPYLSAWIDNKTGRFVGYEFHIEPENTGHVLTTLGMAVSRFGSPEIIYVDNGKTYANAELEKILPATGINKKHAIVKNAQAKFIERIFGIFHQECEKNLPNYTGTTKLRVPKSTEINLKLLAKNENIEAFLTFDEYVRLATEFIEEIYLKSVFEKGMRAEQSPLSMWNAEYDETKMTKPSNEALSLMFARSSAPFTVHRHQINDSKNNISYDAEKLTNGTKVYLRRNPKDLTTAYAYGLNGNYIATLTVNPKVAAIYENDEEFATFKLAIKQKQSHEKIFIRENVANIKSIQKNYLLSPGEILSARKHHNDYRSAKQKTRSRNNAFLSGRSCRNKNDKNRA